MLRTFFVLALSLSLSLPLLTAQMPLSPLPDTSVVRHYTPTPPGLLESFLKENPTGTVFRHNLGGLSAPGGASAKFIAVVASDPLHPEREAKGVEVVLKDGRTNKTVYLDYDPYPDGHSDSLEDLERTLTNLARNEGQRFVARQTGSQGPEADVQPVVEASMTGAYDRPAYLPTWCCPRYTQLDIGLYRLGAVTGVILIAPAAKPVSCRFPGASLGEVAKFIQSGRKFILGR